MQFDAGRSADEWCLVAALDARDSERPSTWNNSTRGRGACQYQHRSGPYRRADTEFSRV
jgi:hypothetical protein